MMISNRRRVVDSIEIGLGLKGAIEGFNNEEEELDLGGSLEKMEAAFEAAIDKNTTSHFDNLNLIMAASEGVESGTGFENIEKKFCEYSFNNEKTASEIKNYEDVKREADGETIEAAVGTIVANVTDGPSSSEDSNRVKLETNNDIDDKINEKDAEPVCTDLPPLGNGKQLPKLSIDCSILKNATPLEQLSAISSALRSPYGSALFAISAVTDNDFIFSVAADLVPDYNYHDSRDASLVLETMKEDAANIESSADDGPSSSKAKKRKRSSVDNEREYRCDECGKSFTQQAHLSIHQRKHTGERPYVCPYENCGKRFTQFGNLRTHERKHTGERPYKCSFPGCGKSFSQMGNMKTHEQLHSGVRPHACNIAGCNKSFTQLGNLKSHQLKVHPEMLDAHGDDLPSDPNSGSLEIDTKPVKVIKRGRKPSAAGSRQKSTSNNSSSAIVANTRPNRKAKATSSKVSYDDDIEDEVNDGISLETVPARTKSLDEIPQHMLPPRKRKVSSVFSSASSSSEPEPVSVPHDIEL